MTHTRRIPVLAVLIATVCAFSLPASASASSMTCAQARKALVREIKASDVGFSYMGEASCKRLTSRRVKLHFDYYANGGNSWYAGTATAIRYSKGIDVTLGRLKSQWAR